MNEVRALRAFHFRVPGPKVNTAKTELLYLDMVNERI